MKKEEDTGCMLIGTVVRNPNCPVHGDKAKERAASGPPQVASDGYRKGWDSIFGAKVPVGEA